MRSLSKAFTPPVNTDAGERSGMGRISHRVNAARGRLRSANSHHPHPMTSLELPSPFDPAGGVVIREPERPEPGYWVGCPSVLIDGEQTWLTYRERRPRGAPTTTAPWLIGPGPSGSVRYVNAVRRDGALWIYHEVTSADGAHELRRRPGYDVAADSLTGSRITTAVSVGRRVAYPSSLSS